MRAGHRLVSVLASFVAMGFAVHGIAGCSAADGTAQSSPQSEVGTRTEALCLEGPAFPSCVGHCEYLTCSPAFPEVCCACDDGCVERDDCCCDHATACPDPDPDSCEGHCGDTVARPAGCFCDDECMRFGDCCGDFEPLCWGWPIVYGTSSVDRAPALTVDASRNVYLAAQIAAPYNFGAGTVAVDGLSDVAVTRFDNLANAEWSRRLALANGTEVQSAALDSAGRLHVAAVNTADPLVPAGTLHQLNQATGTINWASSPLGRGFYDVVAKAGGGVLASGTQRNLGTAPRKAGLYDYTASGTTTTRAESAELDVTYRRVAMDTAGNTYVPAWGSGFFGTNPISRRVESIGPTGVRRWSRTTGSLNIRDVAVDGVGSYFVGTCFAGCLTTPVGSNFVAVLHSYTLDAAGTLRFGREFAAGVGPGIPPEFVRIVLGPSGVLHVLGRTFGVLDLGSGSTVGTANTTTVFILRFSSVGGLLSSAVVARTTTLSATLLPRDLAVATNSAIFVAGEFSGPVEITGGAFTTTGDVNGFVARL